MGVFTSHSKLRIARFASPSLPPSPWRMTHRAHRERVAV